MKYSPEQYANVLNEIASSARDLQKASLKRFISLLASHNALGLLPDIIRSYEEKSGNKLPEVIVRAPERESEREIQSKISFKARISPRLDVRLKGGAIVEVGDLRIDNSVAMRLGRLSKALTK